MKIEKRVVLPFLLALTQLLHPMSILQDELTNLNESFTSMEKDLIKRINALATIEEIEECIDPLDDTYLQKLPSLSEVVDIKSLLKNIITQAIENTLYKGSNHNQGEELAWGNLNGSRILPILHMLNDVVQLFKDNRDQPFTHIEYGESGCGQTYIFAYGLLKIGFKNITLHTVGLSPLENRTKLMLDKLNTLEEVTSGGAKVEAFAFHKDDYLKRSSLSWNPENDPQKKNFSQ